MEQKLIKNAIVWELTPEKNSDISYYQVENDKVIMLSQKMNQNSRLEEVCSFFEKIIFNQYATSTNRSCIFFQILY